MGRYNEKNQPLQITLQKELVKSMDLVIDEINKQLKNGERKFTRSMLITTALVSLFTSEGVKVQIEKNQAKGENKNA